MTADDDVLEKNEELNVKIADRESESRRRRLNQSLSVFTVVLCLAIATSIFVFHFNRNTQLSKSDVRQTQLLCAAVTQPFQYSICRQVGLPQRIGVVR